MSDPRNTATTQPTADRLEMLSDDPHNEWAANRALAETPRTPYNERSEKGKKTHDRNGWTRLAIIGIGFGIAVYLGTEWPVYIAVGIMVIFQMANGEGLE
jgi:hypothetical protein